MDSLWKVYNTLPGVEDSYDELTKSGFGIETLGEIFIKHNVHRVLGISLLHKHYDIYEEEVPVQKGLITSPERTLKGRYYPNTVAIVNGKLLGIEFSEEGPSYDIPVDFASDLERALIQYGLIHVLGIAVRHGKAEYFLEHTEGRNNILEKISKEDANRVGNNIPTNWFFDHRPTDACVSGITCTIPTTCTVICKSTANRVHKSSEHSQTRGAHQSATIPHVNV